MSSLETYCAPAKVLDIRGRGGLRGVSAATGVQTFGAVADQNGRFLPVAKMGGNRWYTTDQEHGRERLWFLDAAVDECQRDETEVAAGPLTAAQILSRSGASSFSRRGVVQLEVELETYAGSVVFQIDGGQKLEVYGVSVNVSLLVPTSFVEIRGEAVATQRGTLIDNLTRVGLLAIEESRGRRDAYFSQRITILPTQQVTLEIPAFARELQVRQGQNGLPATNWFGTYGNDSAAPAVVVPFDGTSRQTERVFLGDFTHVRSDVDENDERDFVLTYRISP